MNFLVNAAGKQVMSMMPAGGDVLYYFHRNVLKNLPVSESRFAARFGIAQKHLACIRKYCNSSDIKTFEFGAGYDLFTSLFLSSQGLKNQTAIDIYPSAKDELIHDIMRRLNIDPIPIQDMGINYIAPCDARATGLPDHAFDFIHSTSVLEHIPAIDMPLIMRECHRILNPGGIISFVIDMSDHYSHTDANISKFNFYKYSDIEWKLLNPRISYQNRLRYSDYIKLFKSAGFNIISEELSKSVVPGINLAGRFKKYSTDDLTIFLAHCVLVG